MFEEAAGLLPDSIFYAYDNKILERSLRSFCGEWDRLGSVRSGAFERRRFEIGSSKVGTNRES